MPTRPRDDLDTELSEAQIAARNGFWEHAQGEIAPGAAARDRTEHTPPELIRSLAAQGYLAAAIPEEYGGTAMDMVTFGVLNSEVARACASARVVINVQAMVSHALVKCGSPRQRAAWLPRLATGDALAAFALSEPHVGSDASNIETIAIPEEGRYLLEGTKKWISFGQIADVFLMFAQCEGKPTAFLVERDAPGLTVAPIRGMLGTRASMLAQLTLQGCRVPKENLVGRPGFGMHAVGAAALDLGRYSVAWGCLGLAQDCLQASVRHARSRRQFGEPLRNFQLVKRLLAKMYADVTATMMLCLRAGRLREAGDPESIIQSCLAKYFASNAAARIAADAVQIHGGVGCSEESAVERHFRDAKVMEIIEGSTQMQQLMIANHVASCCAL